MQQEKSQKVATKNNSLKLLSNYNLYDEAKKLIIREHYSGRYSKKLDAFFEECQLRNSLFFQFAMKDAQYLINSLDSYMEHLHVIDIKRIDFMSSQEINSLIHKIGAAKRQPTIADEKTELKTMLDVVGISKDNLVVCNVAGASMEGLISEEDTLFVDVAAKPKNGSIVVVDFDGNLLVKRYVTENGNVWLHSDNPAFEPFLVSKGVNFAIYGVVKRILKSC